MFTRTIVNALLIDNQTVLLARRSAHRRAYPDCWSFPGGHVEDGERIEDALCREVNEEIGVTVLDYCPIAVLDDPAGTSDSATFHMYAVKNWKGNPSIQDEEHTELRWITLDEASLLSDLALEAYRTVFASLRANQNWAT